MKKMVLRELRWQRIKSMRKAGSGSTYGMHSCRHQLLTIHQRLEQILQRHELVLH